MWNHQSGRILKVFTVLNRENGVTYYELARKLHEEYPTSLSFSSFNDFIGMCISTGRVIFKDGKLFLTSKGVKALDSLKEKQLENQKNV